MRCDGTIHYVKTSRTHFPNTLRDEGGGGGGECEQQEERFNHNKSDPLEEESVPACQGRSTLCAALLCRYHLLVLMIIYVYSYT